MARMLDLDQNGLAALRGKELTAAVAGVPPLRRATPENAKRLDESGAALLSLTANPSTDGSYAGLARVTAELRAGLGDDVALWTGKMHHAGHRERVATARLTSLVDAGAVVMGASTPTTSVTASCPEWAIPSCCTPTRSPCAAGGTPGPGWPWAPVARSAAMHDHSGRRYRLHPLGRSAEGIWPAHADRTDFQ
jgi:hypothetical protein